MSCFSRLCCATLCLRLTGSRYPEINKKVEKLVNVFKTFPDYQDIRDIVVSCNRKFFNSSFL